MKFQRIIFVRSHRFFELIIVLASTFLSVTSCKNQQVMYSNLHEITDVADDLKGFLHYVDLNNYREDTTLETIDYTIVDGACASIKCGDIYGRNFDFYYDNIVTFVTHLTHTDNRFESIGISRHGGIDKQAIEEIEASGTYNKHIELIPNLTLDGINENGVVCNYNIVNFENFRVPTSTNPGKKRLHMYFVCRYILDNARSADHAIQLLDERDIFLPKEARTNIHFMIADRSKTYIVEFINHQIVVKEKTGDAQIMTNFYNNLDEKDPSGLFHLNEYACGVERYRWLRGRDEDYEYFYGKNSIFKNYPEECKQFFTKWEELNTVEKMMKALKNNKMSRGYTTTTTIDGKTVPYPIWPSEDCSQTTINSPVFFEHWKMDVFPLYFEEYKRVFETRRRDIGRDWDIWYTSHSSVYDIVNKTLTIVCGEDYDHPTTFTLSSEINKF